MSVPGIQYRVIKSGKGAQPGHRDCATVNYKGTFIDGKIFDQSKPKEPVTFPVGGVIAGWTEALQMMHVGDEWELVIPQASPTARPERRAVRSPARDAHLRCRVAESLAGRNGPVPGIAALQTARCVLATRSRPFSCVNSASRMSSFTRS